MKNKMKKTSLFEQGESYLWVMTHPRSRPISGVDCEIVLSTEINTGRGSEREKESY